MEFLKQEERNIIISYLSFMVSDINSDLEKFEDDELINFYYYFIKILLKQTKKADFSILKNIISYHFFNSIPINMDMEMFYEIGHNCLKQNYKIVKKNIKRLCKDINDDTIKNLLLSTVLLHDFQYNYIVGDKKLQEQQNNDDIYRLVTINERYNMLNDSIKLLELKKRR